MENKSPFSISEEDIRALEQNDGFRIVRAYLANQKNHTFCASHISLSQSSQQTFILHRDILHSLLLPLLQIRSQATTFAAQTIYHKSQTRYPRRPTSPRSIVDLELAFRGAARGAFSWLQCFIAEEHDWCSTYGCPACAVLKTLHSEPFLRIVVASCHLSTHLKDVLAGGDLYATSSHNVKSHSRTSVSASSSSSPSSPLPDFTFWLTAVQQAVSEDDFWGLHFWHDIDARARDLDHGVKDLIRQCCDGAGTAVPRSKLPQQQQQRRAVTLGNAAGGAGVEAISAAQMMKWGDLDLRPTLLPSHAPAPAPAPAMIPITTRPQQHSSSGLNPQEPQQQQWIRAIIAASWMALLTEAAPPSVGVGDLALRAGGGGGEGEGRAEEMMSMALGERGSGSGGIPIGCEGRRRRRRSLTT